MAETFDLLKTPIEPGTTLLEASAGTGKTYALAGVVLRLLVSGRVSDVSKILVVTFTNAATDELVDRIRGRVRDGLVAFRTGEPPAGQDPLLTALLEAYQTPAQRGPVCARLNQALIDFDNVAISTIHGFCHRILQHGALETGQPLAQDFLLDQSRLVQQTAMDVWRRTFYPNPLLTHLAIDSGWTPGEFVRDFYKRQEHPDAKLLPETIPSPEAWSATAETQYANLSQRWQPDVLGAWVAQFSFKKDGAYLTPDRWPATVEQANRFFAAGSLAPALAHVESIRGLGASAIAGHLMKRGNDAYAAHPFTEAVDAFLQTLAAARLVMMKHFIEAMVARLSAHKRKEHLIDPDDLLRHLRAALVDGTSRAALVRLMRQLYSAVLVDEFQDTDAVQYQIFHTAFAEAGIPVYYIGDPKQAIYRFRGADLYTYLDAAAQANQRYSLSRNYRSAADLVRGVNHVFSRVTAPFVEAAIAFDNVDADKGDSPLTEAGVQPLHWWLLPLTEDKRGNPKTLSKEKAQALLFKHIAAECVRLLQSDLSIDGRPLRPSDMAVLVWANWQAREIQAALRELKVPAVVGQSGNVLSSATFHHLQLILQAIVDRQRQTAVCTALATSLWGWDGLAIHEHTEDEQKWQALVAQLDSYFATWQRAGLLAMMEVFLEQEGVRPRLLGLEDGPRQMTNLRHILEILHQQSARHHLSPDALLDWMAQARTDEDLEAEMTELRLETDSNAVQIVTMHKSKGLEYNITFCPFLWEGKVAANGALYHLPDTGEAVVDFALDDTSLPRAEAERIAEDVRLVYVSLTRAKLRCYAVWGLVGKTRSAASALGYLLHQPLAGETSVAKTMASLATESEAQLPTLARTHLQALCSECPESISFSELEREVPAAEPWEEEAAAFTPEARPFPARDKQLRTWRITSYSGLKKSLKGETPAAPPLMAGRDLDEEPSAPLLLGKTGPWKPQGTVIGDCLHKILEHVDLSDPASEGAADIIRKQLRYAGAPQAALDGLCGTVQTMLTQVAQKPLGDTGLTLGALDGGRFFHEWSYYHPVASFRPAAIAEVFAQAEDWKPYAAALRAMDSHTMEGFMTGIIDLLFVHQDRWYVLDWKSDMLGRTPEVWLPPSLGTAMQVRHYVLQYHLYLVAVQRWLRSRLGTAYRYETHVGGAFYIFLRGLAGARESGVYQHRPSPVVIDGLDAVLGASR